MDLLTEKNNLCNCFKKIQNYNDAQSGLLHNSIK